MEECVSEREIQQHSHEFFKVDRSEATSTPRLCLASGNRE